MVWDVKALYALAPCSASDVSQTTSGTHWRRLQSDLQQINTARKGLAFTRCWAGGASSTCTRPRGTLMLDLTPQTTKAKSCNRGLDGLC